MRFKKELTLTAVLLCFFLFRPPLGYDTYAFLSGEFKDMSTPPLSDMFFTSVLGAPTQWYSAWGYMQTIIYLSELAIFVVNPFTVVTFPYLFSYSFRVEDDQLGFLLALPAVMLARERRYLLSLALLFFTLLLWKGALLLIPLILLATISPSPKLCFLIGLFVGYQFIDPLVAEQNPVTTVFFLPLLYVVASSREKIDKVTATFLGVSLLYPKMFYTSLPLLYIYAQKWLENQSKKVQKTLLFFGIVATLLIFLLSFPQPWLNPKEVCINTPKNWDIGRWCEYHNVDMDYKGWPPKELRQIHADDLVGLPFRVKISFYESAEHIYDFLFAQFMPYEREGNPPQ